MNLILDLRRVACHPPHPEDIKHPAEELNLVLQFRRLPCRPSHPQGPTLSRPGVEPGPGPSESPMPSPTPPGQVRADGWIRTSMRRFTGPLPFCIEPRRHKAGAHRVELCRAALETACSPRSTLLSRVSEGNRTRCLDVHSVACHPATPRTPSTTSPGWIRTSALPHVTGMS